jgi:hypothetical protein
MASKNQKILEEFKNSVIQYFDSEAEFEIFLNTPEHFWGSPAKIPEQFYSPKEWLLKSRRPDRLNYAIRTVIELKTSVMTLD